MSDLTFLKLGGSLITDKTRAQTPRLDVIARLADEIAAARQTRPDLRLLLGHGSGSFGHSLAARYGTRAGVRTGEQWRGFAEVSAAAAQLNRIVADALIRAGVPALSLQPSASARCRDGQIVALSVTSILSALDRGLIPLVYGDVAFDEVRGGTIISTEDIFKFLAAHLRLTRILLAGIETGVYSDWPDGRSVIPEIGPSDFERLRLALRGSESTDVTGGMESKVVEMLALARSVPGLTIQVFSGERPGAIAQALGGAILGTVIRGE